MCHTPESLLDPANGLTVIFDIYHSNSRGVDGDAPKELKRVNAKDISRNDITILDKGRRGEAYAVLVTYHPVSPHIARHLDLLICDEGQYIRRVSGSYMNLLQLFKWERLLYANKFIKALGRLIFFDIGFAPGLVDSRNVGLLSLME
ncbi:hypothetical protein FPOAC2_07147 [Fusarium poae]